MSAARLALALLPLVLAACSAPSAVRPDAGGAGPVASGRDGASAAAPRPGGYYLNDGPGDAPPPDLDAIPDARPRIEPLHRAANKPYVIFDRPYVPMTRLEPFRERGLASWYGRRYHGQRTSIGEVYDMYAMTAAHPTLPIPSYARVTHVPSGRSVVVRVNDRGPFLRGRVIDLSWTAAAKLGYVQGGSGEVEVELITDPQAAQDRVARAPVVVPIVAGPIVPVPIPVGAVGMRPAPVAERLDVEAVVTSDPVPAAPAVAAVPALVPSPRAVVAPAAANPAAPVRPAAPAGPRIYLQIGAFAQHGNALAALTRAAAVLNLPPESLVLQPAGEKLRVLAGPYPQRADALAAADKLKRVTDLLPVPISLSR